MSIFNKLQFDDIDSLRNGVYITGSGVYDSPERDVEMVEIPGRDGDLILDNKRFKNVEVKYEAGVKGDTPEDFAVVLRAFRSLLASKRGYKRLTDTYNPDEFRLATFVDAIEVEPTERKRAGQFDLVFNCKPQRFLMSGEAAITMDHDDLGNGYAIFNPTPFYASPMIETEGYGELLINDHRITIDNGYYGIINPIESISHPSNDTIVLHLNSSLYKASDPIVISDIYNTQFSTNGWNQQFYYQIATGRIILQNTLASHSESGAVTSAEWKPSTGLNTNMIQLTAEFISGTSSSGTTSATYNVKDKDGDLVAGQMVLTVTVDYDASEETVTISTSYTSSIADDKYGCIWFSSQYLIATATVNSTETYLGHPTYIDCDLGEVYKIEGGSYISLNKYVDLGSTLPVLTPGENVIYGENSYTSVSVIPRWWLL